MYTVHSCSSIYNKLKNGFDTVCLEEQSLGFKWGWKVIQDLYIGPLSIASTKRCHQSTAKIQSFFLLILSLFIPQRTNIKSHISTAFVTMFCQRQYSRKYIEIGCLLKESLANPNARQLVYEDKREKFIFSENVLPNRELSSIKFYHICKDRENPLFCSGASSRKTFRQSNSFEDKSDIF